jgi:glycine hydroxymethyltransferase
MKDTVIKKLITKEVKRQDVTLDLIASENTVSQDVLEALGTPLTNKYSEGYPGKRYYPGNEYYDEIETLAQERVLSLFKLSPKKWHVNVQPYSGSPANVAIYNALMKPGETLMGMKLASGGHLTHGHSVSLTGKVWRSVQYTLDAKTELIDLDEVEKLAKKERPKVIVSGFTAYPRKINFKRFGDIAKKVGAYHVADISHIAGLIAGGMHPKPFPYADAVMTTTHKTLRGPRGAMIICRQEIADKIDKSVFPGMQGGPHNNVTAAKAIAFHEAAQPAFTTYAKQIVLNAKALAKALKEHGFRLVSGGTDTHLILMDVRPFAKNGMEAQDRLEAIGIIANRNTIPGDASAFDPSGVRLGTPSLTSRGMKEKEMEKVAELIYAAISGKSKAAIKKEVAVLCKRFPVQK